MSNWGTRKPSYDGVIVGAGPNGLAAAITMARAGLSVLVLEAEETVGGGCRTEEWTLPGFWHDTCSAIHPLGVGSPFFRGLSLSEYGLDWIFPPAWVAHPFDDGTAVVMEKPLQSARTLGGDAGAYQRLMGPLVRSAGLLMGDLLGPLGIPRHPLLFLRFGLLAMRSTTGLCRSAFRGERARGFFAGLAAHSILPLDWPFTASFGLVLGILGHSVGWPLPRGGSRSISRALASYLQSLGGEIVTGHPVESVENLPPAQAVLLDVTPQQLIRMAGHRFPARYRKRLERYRYGPAVYKIDYALDGPIPWTAAECARAGTVHLGCTLEEIAASEKAVWERSHSERPFVLVAQQSLFDPTRAPEGKHAAWVYCHVPNGSVYDMAPRIEAQIERFAPGFLNRVLARKITTPAAFQEYNANYIGGDIAGGASDLRQLFTRPTVRFPPYSTPDRRIYLCSSSTPPGAGVHGMCGYFAARSALRRGFSGEHRR